MSMLVRLAMSLRVIALLIALMTKRGLTPVKPSSVDSARIRGTSDALKPSTSSLA
jgi:hypothetical protein